MVVREVCPFHADDDVVGVPTGNDDLSVVFTCDRTRGHPGGGPHSWLRVPTPPEVPGVDGLAAELRLAIDLPAVLKAFVGTRVEYGVVECSCALAHPVEFARMITEFGHNAIEPKRYTASAFLAGALGALGRQGTVAYHFADAGTDHPPTSHRLVPQFGATPAARRARRCTRASRRACRCAA